MDDPLAISVVGLGSAGLVTVFVAWLKSLGLVSKRQYIAVLALLFGVAAQLLYATAAGTVMTAPNVAAAIIAGLTSGFAASGIHDHIAAPIREKLTPVTATSDPLQAALAELNTIQKRFTDGLTTQDGARAEVEAWRAQYPQYGMLVPPGFPGTPA